MTELNIYTDGASRGNPGEAGVGVVIYNNDGEELKTVSEFIGSTTNNVAEYTALLRGLDAAILFGADKVNVYADSELMIKQLKGLYKVKNENLIPLFNQAKIKLREIKEATFNHVPREKNKRADQLANMGIDNKTKPEDLTKPAKKTPAAKPKTNVEQIGLDFGVNTAKETVRVKFNDNEVQVLPKVTRQTLNLGKESMVVKFTLEKGAEISLHKHPSEQVCVLIKGLIKYNVAGQEKLVKPGETLIIEGNVEHSALALEDSEELDIFVPIREDYL